MIVEPRPARLRVPLIAGNWKMYKTGADGAAFVTALAVHVKGLSDREIVVAPPFTGLAEAVRAAASSSIKIAAQDVFWEAEGAFTGEVSPPMLTALGASAVIIGHSERRQYFGETDANVQKKVHAALDHGLLPIMCVGETEAEREQGKTEEVLSRQLATGLVLLQLEDAERVAIAYEPIWAIGTGKTATAETAQEAVGFIRRRLAEGAGSDAAEAVRILYGGSVRPDNIDELMAQPDIDGVLVGGASLKVDSFARIVRFRPPQRA
jgi:triosephosphate isomerase (TIM)